MDNKEGAPKRGHCIHLRVTFRAGELCSSVVVPLRVISLKSIQEQDELGAQVLHRESNNRSSVLALQKILLLLNLQKIKWKAFNLSLLSFIICKVTAKGCFLQICLGRASCSTESIHKTDFRLRRALWNFQIQQPVIMQLLLRCEDLEIFCNSIDLQFEDQGVRSSLKLPQNIDTNLISAATGWQERCHYQTICLNQKTFMPLFTIFFFLSGAFVWISGSMKAN